MKVEFSAFPKAFAGNVAVFVAADKQLLATAQVLDRDSGGTLTRALEAGSFTGGKGQTLTVLGHAGANIARLLLLGVGKARGLDARAAEGLGGVIAAEANAAGHKAVTVVVDPVKGSKLTPAQIAAHLALGAQLRNYRFDKYKTKDKPEQKLSLAELTIVVAGPAEARRAHERLAPTVDAVFFTRDLVSEPANVLYPVEFARRAKELSKLGVKVQVLGEAEMKKLGFTHVYVNLQAIASQNVSPDRWAEAAVLTGQPKPLDKSDRDRIAGNFEEKDKALIAEASAAGAIRPIAGDRRWVLFEIR